MSSAETIQSLNRLLGIHFQSLPMYLNDTCPPWTNRGDDKASEVLAQIACDQKFVLSRLIELVNEEGATPERGAAQDFTPMNDLSLEFLLSKMIELQKRDIASIKECVEALSMAPLAKALAEEALGMAKGHLESLEEVAQDTAPA